MIFVPHKYQAYCIDRIVADKAMYLMLDMGLGKTVVTLTAIARLLADGKVGKPLIIAPKKVTEATWQHETAKWDHTNHLRVQLIAGTAKQRQKAVAADADVYIVSRDNVAWLVDYCDRWPYDMVIIDESTSFKNCRSQRWKALKSVRWQMDRIVLLTGTPAPKGVEDLYAQMWLVDGGERLGSTLTAFRGRWMTEDYSPRWQQYRTYTPLPTAAAEISNAISDVCISMSAADYLQLPDIITDDVPIVLDGPSQKAYDTMRKDMYMDIGDTDVITAANAAALSGKLLQLAGGAVYDVDGKAIHIHDCKMDALIETIEKLNGEHVIIYYWYQHERDRMLTALAKMGRVRVYKDARDEAAWNDGDIDILLAHPASCGYGLNLQGGGHHIIWYSLPNWNLEMYQQAIKRLHRQGQQQPVIVHALTVAGTVDDLMTAGLTNKACSQGAIVAAVKQMAATA